MIRDVMGNEIKKGQFVDMLPPLHQKWIGKVVEVSEGGILSSKGPTAAYVKIVFEVSLAVDPRIAVVPALSIIMHPGQQEAVEKVLEKEPGPSLIKN